MKFNYRSFGCIWESETTRDKREL